MRATPVILVIDDTDDLLQAVAEVLVELGCEALTARSADEALRLLERQPVAPDLILLDVIMPGMTARQFVSTVRDHAAWARAKVLLFTAASDQDVPHGLQVDGFLSKPFAIEQLVQVLHSVGADPHAAV